jgi:hypothetical protein
MEPIKAFTLKRDLVAEYDEEYLEMKVSDLRNKLEALSRANYGPQLEIKEIQNSLNHTKAGDIRTKRSSYQLAYRRYILICPDDELLSVILELKSRLDHLDRNGEEIWSPRKLEAIEHAIRAHDGNGHLRVEVEALAKAIDEGRFRMRRDDDLRRDFLVFAFRSNLILFLVLLCVLGLFVILKVDVHSQWRKLPVLLFGACGGMLSATMQYRRQPPGDLRIEPVQLFFRSVLGAFAAGIVTLFLQLRIVDFPVLHVGAEDGAFLTSSAQYIVAFASGFAERIFFRSAERISPKRAEAPPVVVQHTPTRPAAKSATGGPIIAVTGVRSRQK